VGRKSRIEFLCDKQLRLRSVSEDGTCSYRIVVGTPVVCGRLEFGIAPPDDDDSGGLSEHARELWGLDLVELANGHLQCDIRAHTSDLRSERAVMTVLDFSRFSADVFVDSTSEMSLEMDLHVCRAPERVRLSLPDREYSIAQEPNRVLIKSGDSFVGQLEYILVQFRMIGARAGVLV